MSFYFLALVGCLVLAFGPQAALATFDFVTFSPALQCVPFSVSFSGLQSPTAFPLTLTVVPLNSTPLSIPIPNSAWNNSTDTGHALTFLPLRAGTSFVASLDDADGVAAGLVSDVIKVGAFNDTSCLKLEHSGDSALYTLPGEVSQCEPFQVTYNTSVVDATPSIRAFMPGGAAFLVNQTSSDDAQGTASYVMNALYGSKLALLISDGNGHSATSGLLSVGGTSQSNGTCLTAPTPSNSTTPTNSTAYTSPSMTASSRDTMKHSNTLSQGAIIAIAAASGSVVVVIILAMAFWLVWSRRKAQRQTPNVEQGDPGEKPPVPPSDGIAAPSWDFHVQTTWSQASSAPQETADYTRNPLYTNSKLWFSSPTTPNSFERRSTKTLSSMPSRGRSETFSSPVSSSSPSTPRIADASSASRKTPQPTSTPLTRRSTRGSQRGLPSSPTGTFSTVDIEQMMDLVERFAPGDSVDTAVPPLPRSMMIDQDAYRTSAYLAGRETVFNPPQSAAPSIQMRVRPPTLALDSGSSFVQASGGHRRSPSSQIYREPPQALVPSSPMPSPLPSPL